jgi:phosphatidylserine synthase
MIAAALPFSFVAQHYLEPWMVGVTIMAFSALSLLPIPYGSHKGRQLPKWVLAILAAFFGCSAVLIVWKPALLVDYATMTFMIYAVLGWVPVHKDDRETFRNDYREWSAKLAAK